MPLTLSQGDYLPEFGWALLNQVKALRAKSMVSGKKKKFHLRTTSSILSFQPADLSYVFQTLHSPHCMSQLLKNKSLSPYISSVFLEDPS